MLNKLICKIFGCKNKNDFNPVTEIIYEYFTPFYENGTPKKDCIISLKPIITKIRLYDI